MNESLLSRGRKVALVTGASSGIGRCIALQLAQEGYDVVLTARRLELLNELAAEIERTGDSRCVTIPLDLAASDGASRLIEQVRALNIPINYLVNNAGVTVEGQYLDHDWEAHRGLSQLMSIAPAQLIHHFLPDMLEKRDGNVLNVASLGAFWPCFPGITLYAGAKSFLVRLTHTLAVEYAESGVRFSVVCPFTTRTAFIDTPNTREIVKRMPGFMIQSPETVARIAIDGVRRQRVVQHTSALNHALAILLTCLPPRWIAAGIIRYMALGKSDTQPIDS